MIFWNTGKQIDKMLGTVMKCQNMTGVCLGRNQQSNWSESFELIFVVIISRFVFCEELCDLWRVFLLFFLLKKCILICRYQMGLSS